MVNWAVMDSIIHRVSFMALAAVTHTIRPATVMVIQATIIRATTPQPAATTIHQTDTIITTLDTMDIMGTTAPATGTIMDTIKTTTIQIANESSVCHIIKDTHNNTIRMDTFIDECEKHRKIALEHPPNKKTYHLKTSSFCYQRINQCENGYPLSLCLTIPRDIKRKCKENKNKKYERNPTHRPNWMSTTLNVEAANSPFESLHFLFYFFNDNDNND